MGIDVLQWQDNINWSEVKKAGVEFAMIRVRYRGSAVAGKLMADPYYKQNIEGALAAGIKVGVYFFSQAITVQEAKEEVQFTYNLIKDYNITYPVAFDSEYYNSDRDGRADYLSATQRTLMANTFCIEMQRLGYKPMVYASTSFFQTDLQLSMLTNWQLWVAQYNTVITHKGPYQCWQYTSEYSCAMKSHFRKFGNQSSGTRKSPILCLMTYPFLFGYWSRPCRICGA